MKRLTKGINRLFAFLAMSLLVSSICFMLGIALVGCSLNTPAWKKEAKVAVQNAKFAPNIEDVIPSKMLNESTSQPLSTDANTPRTAVPLENFVLVSETAVTPDIGFLTLEDEINICIERINNAKSLKESVLSGIDRLTEMDVVQNGICLSILEDGSIEYRVINTTTNQPIWGVNLNSDRTIIEILNFPCNINDGVKTYQYTQYYSYNGEVFVDMDTYEFYSDDTLTQFESRHINYREYIESDDGVMNASLVQVYADIDNSSNEPKIINPGVSITAFGGNDEQIYRYWMMRGEDGASVGNLNLINDQSEINCEFYNYDEMTLNISLSANLLDIERIYLSEESSSAYIVYNAYNIIAAELTNGTIIYPSDNTTEEWQKLDWKGYCVDYNTHGVKTAKLNFFHVPANIKIEDALAAYGFELVETELNISSIDNGEAVQTLESIRINQIETVKDIELTKENAPELYENLFDFFDAKLAN